MGFALRGEMFLPRWSVLLPFLLGASCSSSDPSLSVQAMDDIPDDAESADGVPPFHDGVSPQPTTSPHFPEVFDTHEGMGGESGDFSSLGSGDLTVLLLLDKSGSMGDSWDSGSKWDVVLNAFFLGMVGVEDELTIGTLLFPLGGECGVESITSTSQFDNQSGRQFISTWKAKSSGIFPGGGTPLGLAFEHADAAIRRAQEKGLLTERRFRVALLTDGVPNCATDEERVVTLSSQWRSLGVEVHVVGLPGSNEASALLNRIAHGGGTTDYVAPVTGDDAQDTLSVIVR